MSSNPSQKAPEVQKPPGRTDADARIRQMMRDLDMPLDAVPGSSLERKFDQARKSHDKEIRKRERSDLRRAREAARKVFRVKPSLSSRKAATAMLTAGAVGLAAFTSPSLSSSPRSLSVEMMDDAGGNRLPASLLKASAEFKQALIEEEGVRYVVYRDVAGYPTVGVGHLIDPGDGLKVGDRIDDRQVLEFLEGDLKEAEEGVRQLVGQLPLHQHEFDALVDLVYNVGLGNVSDRESPRLNFAIQSGDYERIAAELDYTHAGGNVARGLEFRSERRAKIFLDAAYDDPRESGSQTTV